jgi:hypothetical protein
MLLYEHERTESIVRRIRGSEKAVRLLIAIATVLLFSLTGALLALPEAASGRAPGGVILFGLLGGAIVGYLASIPLTWLSMLLLTPSLEWMCQMLIAQGEVIERLKRKG